MKISKRVQAVSESITLKLNAKAVQMSEEGKKVFNLTAGQLPFRPMGELINSLRSELDFLKSFQYSPVAGDAALRTKILDYFQKSRGVNFEENNLDFNCVVSNGGKHAIINVLQSIIDPGDEVVVIAPYWVSYPEMVNYCEGKIKVVQTSLFDAFVPSIEEIRETITDKTKAIIVNSPNNPTGTHYSKEWMTNFATLMKEFPHVNIISDEIYYELFYYDPKPTYFYQECPELLNRTIIIDGISKNLACTGLRVGWTIAPKELTVAIGKLQGQTTSGANSLVQKALCNFDFENISEYLSPIKSHLRDNANIIRESFREGNLAKSWYQSHSAFYYMVDFSQAPIIDKFRKNKDDSTDYSMEICAELLDNEGIALVPGKAFGLANTARISLVLQKEPFEEAISKLVNYLVQEKS